jgi:hypothetical protein
MKKDLKYLTDCKIKIDDNILNLNSDSIKEIYDETLDKIVDLTIEKITKVYSKIIVKHFFVVGGFFYFK